MCLHLAMTLWLDDESTGLPHQRQSHHQGSWLRPYRQAGAHCCRLLMTSWASGKDTGIVGSTHIDFEGFQVLKTKFKSACPTEGQVINLNCIFFAMASSQDTYQLLIVSHVILSCFDLVTRWWVHTTPQAAHQLQLHVLELGQHVQQVSTTSYPMSESQIVHNIDIWKMLIDETFDIE